MVLVWCWPYRFITGFLGRRLGGWLWCAFQGDDRLGVVSGFEDEFLTSAGLFPHGDAMGRLSEIGDYLPLHPGWGDGPGTGNSVTQSSRDTGSDQPLP